MAEDESAQPGKKDSRAVAEGDQKTAPTDEQEKKDDSPEWKNLSSSNVEQFKYDKDSQELSIRFHGGRVYNYRGVPEAVADGLETTGSAGSYVANKIKGQYPYSHG